MIIAKVLSLQFNAEKSQCISMGKCARGTVGDVKFCQSQKAKTKSLD